MNEIVKELIPYLEKLADKLGNTAEYIWSLQIKQAYVELMYYLVSYLAIGVSWYAVYRFVKWMNETIEVDGYGGRKEKVKRCDDNDALFGMGYAVSIGTVIVGLICIFNTIDTALTVAINPEYWAMKSMIRMFK